MKFEIGKFYRTRDGRKAQIFMLDNGDEYALGAIFIDGIWIKAEWKNIGVGCVHGNQELDLISEWREPWYTIREGWARLSELNGPVFHLADIKLGEDYIKVKVTVEEVTE